MIWIRIAGVFGFLGVALGAFGAHALQGHLSPTHIQIYHTAVLYHLLHTMALLGYGIISRDLKRVRRWPGICFAAGIIIFSGSLYLLALTGISWLGAITPIGGLLLLGGWIGLATLDL